MKPKNFLNNVFVTCISIIVILTCVSNGYEFEVSVDHYSGGSSDPDVSNEHVSAWSYLTDSYEFESSNSTGMSCEIYRQIDSGVYIEADQTEGDWSESQSQDSWYSWDHTWEWNGPPSSAPPVDVDYSYSCYSNATTWGYIRCPSEANASISGDAGTSGGISDNESLYVDSSCAGGAYSNESSWNGASVSMNPYQEDDWSCSTDPDPDDAEFGASCDVTGVGASDSYQATGGYISISTSVSVDSSNSGSLSCSSGSNTWLTSQGEATCSVNGSASLSY